MNILIINQPPFNRGDESAHKGLIRTLIKKIPDMNIRVLSKIEWIESIRQYAVHSPQVEYVYEPMNYLKLQGFKMRGLKQGLKWLWHFHPLMYIYRKHYKWADIVMCAPGGICMGGFQDWDHLFLLHLAKFYRRPLAYYGRSFGPFPTETTDNRRFRDLSLEIIKYFCFFSIRDRKSEQMAQEIGVPYVSTVDSAFLDDPKVEIPYEIAQAIGEKPYMVFVPNYLRWHHAYKERISHETVMAFYDKLIDIIRSHDSELNIVMLPQLFEKDDNYAMSDVRMFRELAAKRQDKRIIVTSDNYSSDIQQTIISQAKYLIGARYHSIVFAINQGIPCIALSYEHKIVGLLETLDKEEWCIDFTESLDSIEKQQMTLDEIAYLLSKLHEDKSLISVAKNKSMDCMERFLQNMIIL